MPPVSPDSSARRGGPTSLIALHVVCPLALAVAIYALYRPQGPAALVSLGHWLCDSGCALRSVSLPSFVVFSLPDALWLYALLSAMAWVWGGNGGRAGQAWWCVAALAGPAHEALQAFGVLAGTFDVWDLLAYGLAAAFAQWSHRVLTWPGKPPIEPERA